MAPCLLQKNWNYDFGTYCIIIIFCCAMRSWPKQRLITYVTEGAGLSAVELNKVCIDWFLSYCSQVLQHCYDCLYSRGRQ